MTGKVCKCGKEFNHTYKGKLYCSLKCANKYNPSRVWNEKNRDQKYRIYYGISIDDYNEIFIKQDGCCRICKRHQSELKRKLSVDHNHETSEIRGLLCNKCNQAIGLLNDDPELLDSAKEYVLLQGR